MLPTGPARRLAACLLAAGLLAQPALAADGRQVPGLHGPVTVPAAPSRVVTLSEDALDAALAVGVKPVGTLARRGGSDVVGYLKAEAGKVALVGTLAEVNAEAIVGLDPDLILAGPGLDKAKTDMLGQIAATVVPEKRPMNAWRELFLARAEVLGKADAGKALIARIDGRVAAVKAKNAGNAGQTAAVIRWMEAGPMVFTWASQSGDLLEAVGFKPVALSVGLKGPHSDMLSLENLKEVDADWLVIAAFGDTGRTAAEAVKANPIYQQLKAVKAGRIIVSDGNLWSSTNGPLAALAQLDDIERAVDGRR